MSKTIDNIKERASKIKQHIIEHKWTYISGAIAAIGTVCLVYLKRENNRLSDELEESNLENEQLQNDLNNRITYSNEVTSLLDESIEIIKEQNERIIGLEDLCEVKDDYYAEMISDDMRHGGSKGAQQMAYLRWNKENNNNNDDSLDQKQFFN